jgi:hypothetical protein
VTHRGNPGRLRAKSGCSSSERILSKKENLKDDLIPKLNIVIKVTINYNTLDLFMRSFRCFVPSIIFKV